MISIGEFSRICEVSTKTLRYYDEIGLLKPSEINIETGYRYYSIEQLETMLFINRLKQYEFSLEEIRTIMNLEELQDEKLYYMLSKKMKEMQKQIQLYTKTMDQLDKDMAVLKEGKSIMSYLDSVHIQLVEVATMNLVSIRKMVQKYEFSEQYGQCFTSLLERIQHDKLSAIAPPMVLFHSSEFTPCGLDTEFAIPVKQNTIGIRVFQPGLCLKTTLHGSYNNLSSIYAKQCKWAKQNGYENNGALYEVYISDPSQVLNENDFVTEIYYPVKKKLTIKDRGKNYE